MSEPTVLTYARYFDLTQDYTLNDPLTTLDTIPLKPKDPTTFRSSEENVNGLIKGFEKAARDYVSLANDEPLPILGDVAKYLRSCTSHTILDMSKIYEKILPDPYRYRKLKLNLPLLVLGGGDAERDARRIRRGIDLQIVIDDFLDDHDDDRDSSRKDELPNSNAVSAELLEWSRTQLEVTMKKEKLDVSMATLKYIREATSTSIKSMEMSKTLLDLTSETTYSAPLHSCSITEEDFQFELETDVPDTPDLLGSDEDGKEEFLYHHKQESDTFRRSDAALHEECWLPNTQADREMDELFREFTHHDFDEQDKVIVNEAKDKHFEELPTAKRRKLVHEINNETIPNSIGEVDVQNSRIRLEDLKIVVPHVPGHVDFEMPVLDPSAILRQGDKSESSETNSPHPGPPPFRIPTIHEALHESMPAQAKVAEKFIFEEKAVMSSGTLLWKEPGLRVLDHDDADDEHIVADNYQIEEWKSNTFMTIQPQSTKGRPTYFFENSSHDEDAGRPGHNPGTHQVKRISATVKTEPAKDIRVKQEFQPEDIEEPTIESYTIPVNPFARAEARFLSEIDRTPRRAVDSPVPSSIIKAQKPVNSPKLSDKSTEMTSMIAKYDMDLRSLLPEAKRRQPVHSIAMKSESILNDSLSSFLDLRGKQFKPPAVKGICKIAEIIDDPITSTQDSFAEGWFSDEPTMDPSPIQTAKSVQQEVIPPIVPLEEPRTVILNSTLLQTKPLLVQFLENPDTTNLTLIYRDIDTKAYHGPDIILNTTACLFITNLQTLNQRPLPGQKSATGLSSAHDRVASLAGSYSQVIVLVHYTTSTDSAIQSKTLSTQASFAAFCQNFAHCSPLDGRKVQLYWLPCVDPPSTSKIVNAWVWQIINCCAYRNGNPRVPRSNQLAHPTLIQEETLWELFLCKAGLNPLAAQVVISSLKRSSVQNRIESEQEATWGLRRLVAMNSQERTKMFGKLIGVDTVERLNKVLSDRVESEYTT